MNELYDYDYKIIDDTLSECAEILKDKVRKREITKKQLDHFLDTLWIFCNTAEKEWTVDFGLGEENGHDK